MAHHHPSTRALATLLAGALIATPGCSYMLMRPPPQQVHPEFLTACSKSPWPVVGDIYWALNTGTAAVVLGALAANQGRTGDEVGPSWDASARRRETPPSLWIATGLFAAATLAFLQSARYGLQSIDACNTFESTYIPHYQLQQPFSQPPAPWPPAPIQPAPADGVASPPP